MSDSECILDQFLGIGYDMLIAGFQVGKVEKQLECMFHVYEMEEVEVFIITSSIVVSIKDKEGVVYTRTKRIREYHTDFYRIELLQQLINEICQNHPTAESIESRRKHIEEQILVEHIWKNRSTSCAIFCLVSMIFTMFFGGTFMEGIAAFLCGIIINGIIVFLERVAPNRFVINMVASAIGGFAAFLCVTMGMVNSVDNVIIGNIMLMIPGLSIVNAFKDMICGDVITGLLRLSDSLIQAAAVALGFALVLIPIGG